MPKFTGDTTEKAIEAGLKSLNVGRSDADIQIVEEGKKGFLGLGRKEAVVSIELKDVELKVPIDKLEKVEVKETKEEIVAPTSHRLSDEEAMTELAVYLTNITKDLGAPAMVKMKREEERVVFHLETDKKGLLIGKHGKVLNAIQYLAQVYIHRIAKNRLSIVVNVGDYRERREAIIKRLTRQTLRQVRETGQPVFLEPMPAFERKQVHYLLSDEKDVTTHSEGNEPHRYLVVELKNK